MPAAGPADFSFSSVHLQSPAQRGPTALERMNRGKELRAHLLRIVPSGSVLLPALDVCGLGTHHLLFGKVLKVRLHFAV